LENPVYFPVKEASWDQEAEGARSVSSWSSGNKVLTQN